MFVKSRVFSMIASVFLSTALFPMHAEIIETKSIESILPYVEEDTLVLFNIAEVLTDSTISLGSSPSRTYIKEIAKKMSNPPQCEVHNALTWLIVNRIPHKAVESAIPQLIRDLQDKWIVVAAFTSRGRTEWYTTEVPGVDDATEAMLESIQIDLKRSPPPIVSIQMEGSEYLSHYRNGIYYSNHMEKGDFLKKILEDSGYRPKNIVFVDDKRDSLEIVDAAMKDLDIPFTGFWYTRTKTDRAGFDPKIAVIQLKHLIEDDVILGDQSAKARANTTYADCEADELFFKLLESIDFSGFPPSMPVVKK